MNSARASSGQLWCWLSVSLIVLGGSLSLAAFSNGWVVLSYKPSREIVYVWAGFELLLVLWIIAIAPWRPLNKVRAICIFCLFKTLLWMLIHVEGYYGDGRPMIAWRYDFSSHHFSLRDKQATVVKPSWGNASDITHQPLDETRPDIAYPGFRGADRTGVVQGVTLDTDWVTNPPELLWRRPLGAGWSSFAIIGNNAVTQEQQDDDEAVSCYDVLTGTEHWTHRDPAHFREVTGGEGPRATPCIHEGRVYALGATGILNCLDIADGKRLWSRNILHDAGVENRIFGMAGSPMIVGEQVIVSPGGNNSTLTSYDAKTGNILWHGGDADASYSSPQRALFRHGEQIVIFHAAGLSGHDPHTGETMWDYEWISQPQERNNVCQPIPFPGTGDQPDRIFLSSGYGQGCALLELTSTKNRWLVKPQWQNRNLKAKFSSVVLSNGFVYGMDEAILTCIDIRTGERRWKQGRYGYGQLILVGDVLLIQAEKGDVVLVAADPHEFRELARIPALDGRTWNHPALAGPYLMVRNDRDAVCFKLPVVKNERQSESIGP
ncbi:MAG: PQQ-binding-like beta-propeller repeat protein [Planctomycetaceae bacterium]